MRLGQPQLPIVLPGFSTGAAATVDGTLARLAQTAFADAISATALAGGLLASIVAASLLRPHRIERPY